MRSLFGSLVALLVVVLAGSYVWTHRHQAAVPRVAVQPRPAEDQQNGPLITVTGPLADYVQGQTPSRPEPSTAEASNPSPRVIVASDHVGPSPVGTSAQLLHKTFSVAGTVDLPFDLPAHAASAQLRGTYQSFLQHSGSQQASETASDVEFLLLNEQQYSDLVSGRPADALFSADGAPEQEINFRMPPTMERPVKYHLVFRNGSPKSGKRLVQAEFHIDF